MPLSRPRTTSPTRTLNASQIRRRVVIVIGRPASICCQCRAENPKEIISSWLLPRLLRNSLTRRPSALKNLALSTTPRLLLLPEQKHHEQISGSFYTSALIFLKVLWPLVLAPYSL